MRFRIGVWMSIGGQSPEFPFFDNWLIVKAGEVLYAKRANTLFFDYLHHFSLGACSDVFHADKFVFTHSIFSF